MMPVRKIPKNHLVVTGGFASEKNDRLLGFESLLEKDYMILLEYDDAVRNFEEQPVRIPVTAKGRRLSPYVPDVLVNFYPGRGGKERKPLLVEVKPTRYLVKHAEKYKPKFAAAKAYAAEHGWQFQIVTEKEIRGPLLGNLKFLREYHRFSPSSQEIAPILEAVKAAGNCTFSELLDRLCGDDTGHRLRVIPVIWNLVATRRLRTDLNVPITDQLVISLATRKTSV